MKYVIFLYNEVDKINFNEVLNTDAETLRVSLEGKSIIKYIGEMPESVKSLKWKSPEYTHQEIIHIIYTEAEWVVPVENITENTPLN
jgi:hypothetical protein